MAAMQHEAAPWPSARLRLPARTKSDLCISMADSPRHSVSSSIVALAEPGTFSASKPESTFPKIEARVTRINASSGSTMAASGTGAFT